MTTSPSILNRAIDWLGRYSRPVAFGDRVRFRRREWILGTRLDLYLIGWGNDHPPFPTPKDLDHWLVLLSSQGGTPPLPASFLDRYNHHHFVTDPTKPADRQPAPRYPLICPVNGEVDWADEDELQFLSAGRYLDLRDSEGRTISLPIGLIHRIRGRDDLGLYQVTFLGGAELWLDRHAPHDMHWTPYTDEAIAALDQLMSDRGQRIAVALSSVGSR